MYLNYFKRYQHQIIRQQRAQEHNNHLPFSHPIHKLLQDELYNLKDYTS